MGEHEKPQGNVEQSQSHDNQSHDRSRAEGHAQPLVQALSGRVGRACAGVCGGFHAEESGQSAEESAGEKGKRHPRVLGVESVGHDGKDAGQNDKHIQHDLVLLLEIGHRPASHILRDLAHAGRTLVFFHHAPKEEPRHSQCAYRGNGDEPKYHRDIFHVD